MENRKTGFENVKKSDYFGGYPTAHIDARIIDGRIIDIRDGAEIKLKDRALVRIVAYKSDIPKELEERFYNHQQKILDTGTFLVFSIYDERNKAIKFEVELRSEGFMVKEGNKLSRFTCREIWLLPTDTSRQYLFEPMRVESLNQAYFQMSMRVNSRAKSHTVNVYDTFYVKGGKVLKFYRI